MACLRSLEGRFSPCGLVSALRAGITVSALQAGVMVSALRAGVMVFALRAGIMNFWCQDLLSI